MAEIFKNYQEGHSLWATRYFNLYNTRMKFHKILSETDLLQYKFLRYIESRMDIVV